MTRGTQSDQTTHPANELRIHLDLGEAAATRQWKQENGARRHFKLTTPEGFEGKRAIKPSQPTMESFVEY